MSEKFLYIAILFGVAILVLVFDKKKINETMKEVIENVRNIFTPLYKKIDEKYSHLILKAMANIPINADLQKIFYPRIVSIIAVESSGNENVKDGAANDRGLMQVTDTTFKLIEKKYPHLVKGLNFESLKNPYENIFVGTLILYDNYKVSSFNLDLATQRYNSASAWNSSDGSEIGKKYLEKVLGHYA